MFPIRAGKTLVPIGSILIRSAQELPEQLAVKKGEVEYSYKELDQVSSEIASGLLKRGLRTGDRIGLIGENSPHWCLAYFSIMKAGMTAVPIDPSLPTGDVYHIVSESGAKVVFADDQWFDEIKELGKVRIVNLNTIEELRQKDTNLPSVPLDSLAVLIYTSGTTGFSKGVMLTHKNIITNVDSIYRSIEYDENDNFLGLLPLHHTFAATCGFLSAIYNRARIYFPQSLKSRDIATALEDYRITVLLVVPLILEKFCDALKRKIRKSGIHKRLMLGLCSGLARLIPKTRGFLFRSVRKRMGMKHIRYIISGGAALPRTISRTLELLNLPIIQGYGLTEASPVLTINPPERPRNDSVGIPIPGVEISIRDPDDDGVGEIIARGENIMLGYYKNEEATREVLKDNWLHTGDLGYIDDGYLHIIGRKKYIIVTPGGKNVYPEVIEERLLQSDYIKEALVIPECREGKEEVVAILYPDFERLDEDFMDLTPEKVEEIIKNEIIKYGRSLPEYCRLRRFTIREEEFPKTTTRKIKRQLFIKKGVEI